MKRIYFNIILFCTVSFIFSQNKEKELTEYLRLIQEDHKISIQQEIKNPPKKYLDFFIKKIKLDIKKALVYKEPTHVSYFLESENRKFQLDLIHLNLNKKANKIKEFSGILQTKVPYKYFMIMNGTDCYILVVNMMLGANNPLSSSIKKRFFELYK
jgi:hypothetical protein